MISRLPLLNQVLQDEGSQLLTSMDDYVKACGADLVVIATRALSSKVRNEMTEAEWQTFI